MNCEVVRTEDLAMSRKPPLPQASCVQQPLLCAGFALDLWLATADDGRAATNRARAELAQHHQLSRGDFRVCAFDHVDEAPQIRISQSHTRNLGAVLTGTDAGLLGVGVDVEVADRVLRPGAQRHFLNAEDDPEWGHDLLAAWVAKEAAFKAIDPHRARWTGAELLLSRLWLRDGAFGICGNPAARGSYRIVELSFAEVRLRLGVAVLNRPDQATL